ncbi:MAG: PAS domain S-box protein [Chloroflexi bacterium]|nr:PAS domain S-box protein [Chloroflexota bacterium]
MKPIVMLYGEQQTGDQLQDVLASHYEIIRPETPPLLDERVDVCVVDFAGREQLASWLRDKKAAETPIAFPVLLVTVHDNLPAPGRVPSYHVDGLLIQPIEAAELLVQTQTLLHLRELTRQLKARQDRLISVSKAIESTSDAISIADTAGKAIYINQAFIDLYGYHVNELNVRGIPESLFVNPAVATDILTAIQQNQTWKGEVMLKTKRGGHVPTLLRADSIEDGGNQRIGLISVHTDITERKQSEAFLREQRIFEKALRNSSAALTGTLELNEVLDRILSNIGHVVAHDMAQIMLIEGDKAQIVRAHGFDDVHAQEWLQSRRYTISKNTELRSMINNGYSVIKPEVDPAWNDPYPFELRSVRSYVGAPIRLKGGTRGFLHLFSQQPEFFTDVHADRLQAFAEHAAVAIQNAQLHGKAQQLATLQERQRLAHELHDAVSQTLYSASVIAEALPQLWERDPEKAKRRLSQLRQLTRGALAEMRTLLLELRPSALAEAEFDELLNQLITALQGRTQIEAVLKTEGNHSLPEDVQTALFYITQETLNNVVKHAQATRVTVSLHHEPDTLSLSVIDDGCGFDPGAIEATSMGLRIMHERALSIGANLSIISQQGQGTQILVSWRNTS